MNNESTTKQHVQLPNNMADKDLKPQDQLIYLGIKRHMNTANVAYPSLTQIKKETGASIDTIRKCIESLVKKDYLTTEKDGRRTKYIFSKIKGFEPFSYDFLDKTDLTFTEKAYLAATQQLMFKDSEGYGKVSYSNEQIANKINMSESTVARCNRSLANKEYLTIIENESRSLETGLPTNTKIFELNKLGQAVIWTLKNHEDRLQKVEETTTSEIDALKKEIAELKKIQLAQLRMMQSQIDPNYKF